MSLLGRFRPRRGEDGRGGAPPLGSILMVSKPVTPPWNDSTKNLVRDIVSQGGDFTFHVMTTPGAPPLGPRVVAESIYSDSGAFSPSLAANLRVMGRLLQPRGHDLYHFFFAPNPRSSAAARLAMRLRRRPSLQTVCSLPRSFAGVASLLFADRVVTVSESTRRRLEAEGVTGLRTILPGIERVPPLPPEQRARTRAALGLGEGPVALFAGDYEFSSAARTFTEALLRVGPRLPAARFVFACRIKTAAARAAEAELRAQVLAAGLAERVIFLNQVDEMRELLAAVDLQVMPADSTYAKMDLPLVLLEGLQEGVPVLVADVDPLREILAADVGRAVPPRDPAALAAIMEGLLRDRAQLRALGERGRELVRERFDAARMAREYQALYRELLVG